MTICSLDIDWFAMLLIDMYVGVHNQRWLWLDKELLMCHSVSTAVHALHLCVHFQATGTRLGMLLESSFGLLLSLVIAALYSWVLTLVILCFVPIMMATGILQMKGLTAHVADYKVALENAGKVVQILFSILL